MSPEDVEGDSRGLDALEDFDERVEESAVASTDETAGSETPEEFEDFASLQDHADPQSVDESEHFDAPPELGNFDEADDEDQFATPPEMTKLLYIDVVLLLPATHPVVVLQEANEPYRELRIPVGGAEGIAIAYAGRGIETPRPLTHEMFTDMLAQFDMTLDVVRITKVRGSTFTAEMVLSGSSGRRLIDCRPSDAIALALRQSMPVPIMVAPYVMAAAGTNPLGAN